MRVLWWRPHNGVTFSPKTHSDTKHLQDQHHREISLPCPFGSGSSADPHLEEPVVTPPPESESLQCRAGCSGTVPGVLSSGYRCREIT